MRRVSRNPEEGERMMAIDARCSDCTYGYLVGDGDSSPGGLTVMVSQVCTLRAGRPQVRSAFPRPVPLSGDGIPDLSGFPWTVACGDGSFLEAGKCRR